MHDIMRVVDGDERVTIREARPADRGRVGALTVAAYRAIGAAAGGYEAELGDVAGHARSARVLVAEVDGTVVGAVTYVPGPGPLAEWDDPQAAGFRFLAVAPEAQGRGVGRALVEACIAAAREEARPCLFLHSTDRMETAQRMYRRLGFQRVPELDEEVLPGYWLRGYRLELAEDR
jgi:ribosomal protein S18 acetylase RimI-like enzyme